MRHELGDYGVKSSEFPKLAAEAAQQWTAGFNPAPDRCQGFRAALHGGFRMRMTACLLLAFALPVFADWPMHRGGPQLRGLAQMPAPAKPDQLWAVDLGKPIKAGAAIAESRVFVGDDTGVVHALELATGKELWTYKTQGGIEATPLVLDGVVFIGSSDANLYALDAANGSLKWKYAGGRQNSRWRELHEESERRGNVAGRRQL